MARTATAPVTTPAVTVNPLDPTGAIAAAKAAVPAGIENRSRALRDAALDAAATAYGPFTVEGDYTTTDGVKFAAWITGARGHSGIILVTNTGTRMVTGRTTALDFLARNAITNPAALTGPVAAPTVKGILV